MCNLYDMGRALRHRSRDDWEEAVARALKDSRKAWGIRKTDPGLVVTLEDGSPTASTMRWGFAREFNPCVNNARSDKLDGMWSGAWRNRRRCLIPVATFYEWTGAAGNKQTYAFEPAGGENLLWAAGLWEPAPSSSSLATACYTMLTTRAKGSIATIHDRMPAFLQPEQFTEFLESADPRSLLDSGDGNLTLFRCENPLKNPDRHEGPVRQAMLPGFEE
ncbi:MAG: SOS response-associated peptidase family protein [Verrucomicrobiales bacterium]|nr:SOS response-associated peptidase family protein [Verrucomicrobiales bacterium]